MMQGSAPPASLAAAPVSADKTYEVELSDKTKLLATPGGGQTCWINRKAQVRLCY